MKGLNQKSVIKCLKKVVVLATTFLYVVTCYTGTYAQALDKLSEQVLASKSRWGLWDTRSVLTHVYLADAISDGQHLGITLGLHKTAKNGELFLTEALVGRKEPKAEFIKPLICQIADQDQFQIDWEGASFLITSIKSKADLKITIKCLRQPQLQVRPMFRSGTWWSAYSNVSMLKIKSSQSPLGVAYNSPGGGNWQEFDLKVGQELSITATVAKSEPDWAKLDKQLTHVDPPVTTDQQKLIQQIIRQTMSLNTIYDPVKKRLLSTVNRIWNVERGGYVVFCWDNFFGSILWSKTGVKEDGLLSQLNFKATLAEVTTDGFVPNNSQANGRAAFDRSQPPVGAIALAELIGEQPDKLILESYRPEIERLLKWNVWWWRNRLNGSILSWGSKEGSTPNIFFDAAWNNRLAAALESGADDSPAYDDVVFDQKKGLLMLHDVALNSLYIRDCELLAKFCKQLGLSESFELEQRAKLLTNQVTSLYDPIAKVFKNRHVTGKLLTDTLSSIITPFNFLPLITGAVKPQLADQMVKAWMMNPAHFGGAYPLPSVDKAHPSYAQQRYWRGATWPPMNYLVWLGLRRYPNLAYARKWLGNASRQMLIDEYQRKGYVCENYSNFTGTCDDGTVKAEYNYFWGALLGIMD